MTISTTASSVQYVRNGTTTQWSYPNKIFSATDLVVNDLDTSVPPIATLLVLNTDYTVSNVDVDTGALVTTTLPGIAGHTLDIRSSISQTQLTSIKNQGSYLPELHEEFFDRITREVQDLRRLTYLYGIHGPDNEVAQWPALPPASTRRNTALMFDALTGLPALGVPNTQTITTGLLAPFLNLQQSAAEIAGGITPVNFSWQPGDVRRYGAVGNGIADDTVAVQSAATGGAGTFIAPAGTYKLTARVTFNQVQMSLYGSVLFTGSGSIRGILRNDTIPHGAFQVPYNLVTSKERLPVSIAGNYFVDPLIGLDANPGTSAAAPFETLTAAAAAIASVALTAPSLTIVLRSGRIETSGLALSGAHTLTSGGAVNWTANAGEKPTISAPTKWFFRSSAVSATSGPFTAVANPLAYAFWDLYDAESGEQVECTNNMHGNFSLPRNQALATTIGGGGTTLGLTLNAEDTTNFTALSATEKAGVRMRVNQWFTSSWHGGLSIAGSVITGDCQTNTAAYNNGWNVEAIDVFGAPYLLQNIKAALNGSNFCGYSDNVWLPQKGTNYFTVDNTVVFLVNTGVAAKHFFNGIRFRYLAAPLATLKTLWTGGPFNSQAMLIGGSGVSGATACDFSYGNLSGVIACQNGGIYSYNTGTKLGLCGISFSNAANGSDNVTVTRNRFTRWGHYSSLASPGIWVGGVGIDVEYNWCESGPWAGLRVESSGNIVAPSGTASGNVLRNVAIEVGYVDEMPADYIANNDTGVLTIFGNATCSYVVKENVVGRGFGYWKVRGIFADQGINGVLVYNNLIWGMNNYAIDFRAVSTLTFNNSFRNNICFGPPNIASQTATTDVSGNLFTVTYGGGIVSTATNVTPNSFGCRGDGTQKWPSIDLNDPAFVACQTAASASPWVLSFLKRMQFLNSSMQMSSLGALQTPITVGTYGVSDVDTYLTFNNGGGVSVVLPTGQAEAGRELNLRSIAGVITSSVANITPLAGGAATSALLSAAGKWCKIICNGSNGWTIMQSN